MIVFYSLFWCAKSLWCPVSISHWWWWWSPEWKWPKSKCTTPFFASFFAPSRSKTPPAPSTTHTTCKSFGQTRFLSHLSISKWLFLSGRPFYSCGTHRNIDEFGVEWCIDELKRFKQTETSLCFPQHLIIHIFLRSNCNDNIHQQSKFPYSQNPDRPPIPAPKVLPPLPKHSSSRFHQQTESSIIPWVLVTLND